MSDIVTLIEARVATAIEVGQRRKDRRNSPPCLAPRGLMAATATWKHVPWP